LLPCSTRGTLPQHPGTIVALLRVICQDRKNRALRLSRAPHDRRVVARITSKQRPPPLARVIYREYQGAARFSGTLDVSNPGVFLRRIASLRRVRPNDIASRSFESSESHFEVLRTRLLLSSLRDRHSFGYSCARPTRSGDRPSPSAQCRYFARSFDIDYSIAERETVGNEDGLTFPSG